ncbi:hypothetical protein ABIE12_001713 [Serratia sp. 509]
MQFLDGGWLSLLNRTTSIRDDETSPQYPRVCDGTDVTIKGHSHFVLGVWLVTDFTVTYTFWTLSPVGLVLR